VAVETAAAAYPVLPPHILVYARKTFLVQPREQERLIGLRSSLQLSWSFDINESAVTDIPDAAFRFSGGQCIFNMATSNLTQGSTYTFRINLAIGNIQFVVGVK